MSNPRVNEQQWCCAFFLLLSFTRSSLSLSRSFSLNLYLSLAYSSSCLFISHLGHLFCPAWNKKGGIRLHHCVGRDPFYFQSGHSYRLYIFNALCNWSGRDTVLGSLSNNVHVTDVQSLEVWRGFPHQRLSDQAWHLVKVNKGYKRVWRAIIWRDVQSSPYPPPTPLSTSSSSFFQCCLIYVSIPPRDNSSNEWGTMSLPLLVCVPHPSPSLPLCLKIQGA